MNPQNHPYIYTLLKAAIIAVSIIAIPQNAYSLADLINDDFSGAVDTDGDNTRDFTDHGTSSGDNTDQGWTAICSNQRDWVVCSGQMQLNDWTGDNSGAGGFLQTIQDNQETRGIIELTFDLDYTLDACGDVDLDVYVIGWNAGDTEAKVDFGNVDVSAGDTMTLNCADNLITQSGVGSEGLGILSNGTAQNGYTITSNDCGFDTISLQVNLGFCGYDYIGVMFYGEALDDASCITESIIIDNADFGGEKVWAAGGGNNDWTNCANWNNWDGADATLCDGDVLLYNNTGAARTTSEINFNYCTELGSVLFRECTAYTLTDDGGSLIFQCGGGILNQSSVQQTIQAPVSGRDNTMLIDAGDVCGGSLLINGGADIDLSHSGGVALTVQGANNTTISTSISGCGATLTKNHCGTLTLNGTTANSYSGVTTVNAGTVILNKTAGIDAIAGNLTIASGATVCVHNDNQINDNCNITLEGGTLDIKDSDETVNNVSLTANSVIDFSGTDSVLNIDDLDLNGFTLSIYNWDGNYSGGGAEQFIVNGSITGGTVANNIRFYSDNGSTPLGLGAGNWSTQLASLEVVPTSPIPETSTWLTIFAILSILIIFETRRRLKKSINPTSGEIRA